MVRLLALEFLSFNFTALDFEINWPGSFYTRDDLFRPVLLIIELSLVTVFLALLKESFFRMILSGDFKSGDLSC